MRVARSAIVAVAGVFAVVLGASSLAWACSAQARVLAANPPAGLARSPVTVRGEAVTPSQAVEIRWNSVQGERVGSAVADASGNFSAQATVPDAAPGVYSLIVVAGDTGVGRMAFEVTPALDTQPVAALSPASHLNGARSAWDSPARTQEPSSSPGGLGLGAGVGLLAVGLVVLFAGSTVAVTRRRRVIT